MTFSIRTHYVPSQAFHHVLKGRLPLPLVGGGAHRKSPDTCGLVGVDPMLRSLGGYYTIVVEDKFVAWLMFHFRLGQRASSTLLNIWSETTLDYWMMMLEWYPHLKEEVGSSILGCEISSLLDGNLALVCWPSVSKRKENGVSIHGHLKI